MADYSLPRIKENELPEATSIDKVRVLDDAGKSVWVEKEDLPIKETQVTGLTDDLALKADKSVEIIAGAGLTGGGDLSAARTFNVVSADDGITVNANDIKLNIVNNLTTSSATRALSATQGKKLQDEKEALANKSTNIIADAESTTKYPSVKLIKDYADSLVVGLLDYRGGFDASVNAYPSSGGSGTGGAILKGDMWVVSVAGVIDGHAIHAGDSLIANDDTPGQTTAKWNTVQSNLSYVPEDVANKSTNVTSDAASDTKYPSVKAVKTYADKKVSLTGNETIEDVKTFSSSPIVPTPTSDTDAANKAYVDSAVVTTDNVSQDIEEDTTSETKVPSVKAVEGYVRDVILRQKTWSIPIKQNQSDPEWGVEGDTDAWDAYKAKIGRYLMKTDGKCAKLDPTDSSFYADGTAADESIGQVVTIIPPMYFKVVAGATFSTIHCSESPIAGGQYIPLTVVGSYKAGISNGALISRSGYAPRRSRTISQFWAEAQVNGTDWGLVNYDFRRLMMILGLSEYGNPNIQAKLGYGICGSVVANLWDEAQTLLTGATKTMGDVSGKIDITLTGGTDCSRVNFFGIEDPYGWQWEMTQNVFFGSSANAGQDGTECFIYEGNRMPSSGELATNPDGAYRQLVRPTTSDYVQRMLLGEHFDLIPELVSSSADSATYWCDYFYGSLTGQLLLWGGLARHGPLTGLGCAASTGAFSSSSVDFGTRLAYYGDIEILTGAELVAL